MNLNLIHFNNVLNNEFNFKKLLDKTDSLLWKNCSNIKIKIKSKINKLILRNCKDIIIKIGDTISGIDIDNCKNIKIKILSKYNKNTYIIDIYKSTVSIKNINKKIILKNYNSIIKK